MHESPDVSAGHVAERRPGATLDGSPLAARSGRPQRAFIDAEHVAWIVRECVAPRDACPRGTRCLIFEAEGRARRVWTYPPNWREMDEAELARLSLGT
jgi:hypothetical protein